MTAIFFYKLFKGAAATAVATCVTYPLQIVQARARVTIIFIIFIIGIILMAIVISGSQFHLKHIIRLSRLGQGWPTSSPS